MSFKRLGDWGSDSFAFLGSPRAGRDFEPIDLPNLELWVKADGVLWQDFAKTILADGNNEPVGAWPDLSGNGRDLLQNVNAGFRPMRIENVQNGKPILRFDGGDDYLNAPFTLLQPYTLFIVVLQDVWADDHIIGGVTANAGVIIQAAATPQISLFSGVFVTTGALAVDVFGIVTAEYDGATSFIQVDEFAAVTGNVGANNPGGVRVAGNSALSRFADVDVGEIIVYDGMLSVSNRNTVRNYLNGRWATF